MRRRCRGRGGFSSPPRAARGKAGPRPASRLPSTAIAGMLATANSAEKKRMVSRPPPRAPRSRRGGSATGPRRACRGRCRRGRRSVAGRRTAAVSRPRAAARPTAGPRGTPRRPPHAATPATNSLRSSSAATWRRRGSAAPRRRSWSRSRSSNPAEPYARKGLWMTLVALSGRADLRVRCPNGHLFEVFHRINDPDPEVCEVCGAALTKVFHPVPIHFKVGLLLTDYGRGSRKRDASEGDGTEEGRDEDRQGRHHRQTGEEGRRQRADGGIAWGQGWRNGAAFGRCRARRPLVGGLASGATATPGPGGAARLEEPGRRPSSPRGLLRADEVGMRPSSVDRVVRGSWWGGPSVASTGEPVTVYLSDAFPQDESARATWVNFFAWLQHGSELPSLTVYVALLSEVQSFCGPEAGGCYSPARRILVIPGDLDPGVEFDIAAHEYGHHIAANRRNDPGIRTATAPSGGRPTRASAHALRRGRPSPATKALTTGSTRARRSPRRTARSRSLGASTLGRTSRWSSTRASRRTPAPRRRRSRTCSSPGRLPRRRPWTVVSPPRRSASTRASAGR